MGRRLTTVLSADVVGYSHLMGADEERTLGAFRVCRDTIGRLIEKHGGRIFGEAGDGVIAEFGSSVEAVRASVQIQTSLSQLPFDLPGDRKMQFRIGINLGDVMVEAGNLYGDAVNIAARIEGFAKPGGVAVSSAVRDQVDKRLDLAFEDMGEQSLKNIDRPIHIYHIILDGYEQAATTSISARRSATEKPSIAVLPFTSFAVDDRWERIADGIVEEIITDLVRHGEMAVIACSSTFAFKGKSVDLRDVGRSLGADYLLIGSIQVSSSKIRLNVQLVDSETGVHVWAGRLDRSEGDLFDLEDAVVEAVAGSVCGMEGAVVRAHLARLGRRRPATLESFELFLLGLEGERTFDRERTLESIDFLQRSLALDPKFARGWLVLAYCWEHVATNFWQSDIHFARQERRRAIFKAADLDPNDPLVKIEVGDMYFEDGNSVAAKAAFEQALASGRTNADAMTLIAKYVAGILGRPNEALQVIDRALRLHPFPPSWYYMNKLRVCYFVRDYASGLEAVSGSPDTPTTRLFEALCLAGVGRKNDAEKVVEEMTRRYPDFEPSVLASEAWINGAEALNQFANGLREVGLANRRNT
ncbi:adenylate/guanylate cyclase domain-containing protein [Rhizobium leguminosarum]|uniref:adenylate/guanylate cyclase domain-containing protein n=1 Tax=Rhizobium leguminosarum TaxID=384 RepID=UPI001AE861DA|nr:adenylate/guanylate cyclase domain-containing protein [Rhizobium leguminosarum]MBP2446419.1 TolB-like protein/class 3 adenylate cyclase [Rhizobium leguminosarum]